jgi:hypothetical protein
MDEFYKKTLLMTHTNRLFLATDNVQARGNDMVLLAALGEIVKQRQLVALHGAFHVVIVEASQDGCYFLKSSAGYIIIS